MDVTIPEPGGILVFGLLGLTCAARYEGRIQ